MPAAPWHSTCSGTYTGFYIGHTLSCKSKPQTSSHLWLTVSQGQGVGAHSLPPGAHGDNPGLDACLPRPPPGEAQPELHLDGPGPEGQGGPVPAAIACSSCPDRGDGISQ